MTTRRGFLRMLGFAPVAAAVPLATAVRSESLFQGGLTWCDASHDELPEPLRSVMAGDWVQGEVKIDTEAMLRDTLSEDVIYMLKDPREFKAKDG